MKNALILFLLFISLNLMAQDKHKVEAQDYTNTSIEMADTFRQEGKIYVVVAVASIILAGLLIYAFNLDRKISKLEEEIKPKNTHKTSY
ncbi:MAG: CcmD family protein [Bacteroidota bacterium]|nr:CcmD family protein [Bacteroidota bacterium]